MRENNAMLWSWAHQEETRHFENRPPTPQKPVPKSDTRSVKESPDSTVSYSSAVLKRRRPFGGIKFPQNAQRTGSVEKDLVQSGRCDLEITPSDYEPPGDGDRRHSPGYITTISITATFLYAALSLGPGRGGPKF